MDSAVVSFVDDELTAALADFRRRGNNQRDAMRHCALILVEEVDDMFETSGHGQWPPLAASTRKYRGESARILMDTGRLAASITPKWDGDSAEAYTNVSYAKYHTSDGPRAYLPKRDFFDINIPAVVDEFVDFILKKVAE
jgi:phage gpG-like protein